MLYEHYLDLAARADALIAELIEHPDERTRERVVTLLEALDLLHREGLVRLADVLRAAGAADALNRAPAEDPVVRILLGLYGLAELDVPEDKMEDRERAVGFFPADRLTVRRASTSTAAEGEHD